MRQLSGSAAAARSPDPLVAEVGGRWVPATIAVVGVVVAAWNLVLPLSQPLRGDELTSLFRYIGGGPSAIWGHYITNDHVLFELLTWMLRAVTGDRSIAVVRFWSVVPAIAAVAILTMWLWRRLDPWIAAVFAVLAASAPAFLTIALEARGYGLAGLAAVLTLIGADAVARTHGRRAMALFVVGSIIGIWTLPIFGATFAALVGLLFFKRIPRRDLLVAVAIVAVASLVFYGPLLGQIVGARSTLGGQQLALTGFVVRPFEDLLQPSVQALLHQISPAVVSNFAIHLTSPRPPAPNLLEDLIAALAVAAGVILLLRGSERFLAAALLIPMFFSYLALELLRSYVLSRFASFLLPLILVLCAAGIVGAARLLPAARSVAALLVAAGIAFSLLALSKGYRLAMLDSRPSAVPTVSNDPSAFGRYLDARWITSQDNSQLQALFCDRAKPFVLLQVYVQPETPRASACFAARPTIEIASLQVATPTGSAPATVWDVPGAAGVALAARR